MFKLAPGDEQPLQESPPPRLSLRVVVQKRETPRRKVGGELIHSLASSARHLAWATAAMALHRQQ